MLGLLRTLWSTLFPRTFLEHSGFTATPPNASCHKKTAPETVLHVLPYPDIPGDFARMLDIIRLRFEAENPDIAIQFTHSKVSDAYKIDALSSWLTDPVPDTALPPEHPIVQRTVGAGVDIVEVDTMMLGALVERDLLGPPLLDEQDWHPAARSASSVHGRLCGVPHWMCGNFIISRHEALTRINDVRQLAEAMTSVKSDAPYLSGNFRGSAFFILNYIQAWAGNQPHAHDLQHALDTPVDQESIDTLRIAAGLCLENGRNPCLNEFYHNNPDSFITRTVTGDYAALMGFSEIMWYLAQAGADPEEWHIGPVPLGKNNKNILLADAYVVRKDLSPQKRDAARRFCTFMMRDDVYRDIMLSGGCDDDMLPRYIIPARTSVMSLPGIKEDIYYQRISHLLQDTLYYPNMHVPEARERIYNKVIPMLMTGQEAFHQPAYIL